MLIGTSKLPRPRTPSPEPPPAGPAADATGALSVEVAASVEEFARLAPAWNAVHDGAHASSVFNSWLWLYEWWRTYGARRELRILVARREGTLVGVLPLHIERGSALGVPVRLLRFVGTGGDTSPDDLGPVLASGEEAATALALGRAALRLPGVDVWLFSDIDSRSAFPAALEAAARELGLVTRARGGQRIALTELPAAWDRFLESLSRSQRWRLRRSRRRLAKGHRVRFFVWQDAPRIDWAVDRLAELHRRRRAAVGEGGSFRSEAYLRFHRAIIRSFFARGCVRLYCLEIDGEIGAMLYCYRFRNRIYLMQAGFDPAYARLSVGKVLLGHALEHAIAEGNEAWDFLRGDHQYKEELATAHRQTSCVHAFAPTAAALAYRARRVWLPRLKAGLARRKPCAHEP